MDGAVEEFMAEVRRATHPDPFMRHPRVEDLMRGVRQALGLDGGPPAIVNGAPTRTRVRNPYKGLRAFQEADVADFFGRSDLIERLRSTVLAMNFVAVVGPSGIGKSSVVKAGLSPRCVRADRKTNL